jgi:hypothetical protein
MRKRESSQQLFESLRRRQSKRQERERTKEEEVERGREIHLGSKYYAE